LKDNNVRSLAEPVKGMLLANHFRALRTHHKKLAELEEIQKNESLPQVIGCSKISAAASSLGE